MRLKIISAYDENFSEVGKFSEKSIKIFSAARGCDFEIYRSLDPSRPPAWSKIKYLLENILNGGFDYILWVDADACFVRADMDILEGISLDCDIHMVNHLCRIETPKKMQGLEFYCERPNAGVLLVKCSQWSVEFLRKVWAQNAFINHGWWEQAAFHYLMGYHFEISGHKKQNSIVKDVMSHIGWLDGAWNSVPTGSGDGVTPPLVIQPTRSAILHLAGMPQELRIKTMRSLVFNSFPFFEGDI